MPYSLIAYECYRNNGHFNPLIMRSNIGSITNDKDIAELIVDICFMVTALKHQSETEEIDRLKKISSGAEIIQTQIDNMLGSDGPNQFLKNVSKGENTIGELLELYAVLPVEISNKEEIQDTLKDLKKSMESLRQKSRSISKPEA